MRTRGWRTAICWIALLLALAVPTQAFAANDTSRHHVLDNIINAKGLKGNILWYDLAANVSRLNSREAVEAMLDKTKQAHIDTIVLDVKNYTGYVAYQSDYAPHISTSKIPNYQGYFAPGYDLLQVVLEEAHERGIRVHAAVNVFSEGSNDFKDGPAFAHPQWQSHFYYATQVVTAADGSAYDLFGVDVVRGTNALVKYTPGYTASPRVNRWGAEAVVVGGTVTAIVDGVTTGQIAAVPANGYVLSGHGLARTWLLEHLKVGDPVDLTGSSTRIVPAIQYPTFSTFVNPLYPEVRQYELNIIRELATNYDVDGIVLDRARYSNIYADFSDVSRQSFEQYIGSQVQQWPADIFTIKFTDNGKEIVPGPLYTKWIEWRAHNIFNFFYEAKTVVKSIDDSLDFSTYVGSWYPYYYNEGVNWGSQEYYPDEPWASPDYHKYGYADMLDFIQTGLYYTDITEQEAIEAGNPEWMSVEGGAHQSTEAVNEATFVYGSLYLLQYEDDPERFREAIRATLDNTHGIMVFDLVYLEWYDWWHILEEELKKSHAPHENPGLSKQTETD